MFNDKCPGCGVVPLVKKRRWKDKVFWEYTCNCSKAIVEAKVWEKKVDAMAKLADVWFGYRGLILPKSSKDDILEIYCKALEEMVI